MSSFRNSMWVAVISSLSGCISGVIGTPYTPSSRSDIDTAIGSCIELDPSGTVCPLQYGNISDWDTSQMNDFSALFQSSASFRADLGAWDVSRVTDMGSMFREASAFNSDLQAWDTSKVVKIDKLFYAATSFNNNISMWDTSRVTNLYFTFFAASSFNAAIGIWDVANVLNMGYTFRKASVFNSDIASWDASKVTDMKHIFGESSFNGNLSSWDTAGRVVTDMHGMFFKDYAFEDGQISQWDVARNTDMEFMFIYANAFNGEIGDWDTSKVTTMDRMFDAATSFNSDISMWDVSMVTSITRGFRNALNFCYRSSVETSWTAQTNSSASGIDNMFDGCCINCQQSASLSESATSTASETVSSSSMASHSSSKTPTASLTASASNIASSSLSASSSGSVSESATSTASETASPTSTASHSSSKTPTASRTASASGSASDSFSASLSGSVSGSATPTASDTASSSSTASFSASTPPTASRTASASSSASSSLSASSSGSVSESATSTTSETASSSWTASHSSSKTPTASLAASLSGSVSSSLSASSSGSTSGSATTTVSETSSSSSTASHSASTPLTASRTASASNKASSSLSESLSDGVSESATTTASETVSSSSTASHSSSKTPTASLTASASNSASRSLSASSSGSVSRSATTTASETASPSSTVSQSASTPPTASLTTSVCSSSSSSLSASSSGSASGTPTSTASEAASSSSTASHSPSTPPTGSLTASVSNSASSSLSASSSGSMSDSAMSTVSETFSSSPVASLSRSMLQTGTLSTTLSHSEQSSSYSLSTSTSLYVLSPTPYPTRSLAQRCHSNETNDRTSNPLPLTLELPAIEGRAATQHITADLCSAANQHYYDVTFNASGMLSVHSLSFVASICIGNESWLLDTTVTVLAGQGPQVLAYNEYSLLAGLSDSARCSDEVIAVPTNVSAVTVIVAGYDEFVSGTYNLHLSLFHASPRLILPRLNEPTHTATGNQAVDGASSPFAGATTSKTVNLQYSTVQDVPFDITFEVQTDLEYTVSLCVSTGTLQDTYLQVSLPWGEVLTDDDGCSDHQDTSPTALLQATITFRALQAGTITAQVSSLDGSQGTFNGLIRVARPASVCGDGWVDDDEDCDLGVANNTVDSGCMPSCETTEGFVCSHKEARQERAPIREPFCLAVEEGQIGAHVQISTGSNTSESQIFHLMETFFEATDSIGFVILSINAQVKDVDGMNVTKIDVVVLGNDTSVMKTLQKSGQSKLQHDDEACGKQQQGQSLLNTLLEELANLTSTQLGSAALPPKVLGLFEPDVTAPRVTRFEAKHSRVHLGLAATSLVVAFDEPVVGFSEDSLVYDPGSSNASLRLESCRVRGVYLPEGDCVVQSRPIYVDYFRFVIEGFKQSSSVFAGTNPPPVTIMLSDAIGNVRPLPHLNVSIRVDLVAPTLAVEVCNATRGACRAFTPSTSPLAVGFSPLTFAFRPSERVRNINDMDVLLSGCNGASDVVVGESRPPQLAAGEPTISPMLWARCDPSTTSDGRAAVVRGRLASPLWDLAGNMGKAASAVEVEVDLSPPTVATFCTIEEQRCVVTAKADEPVLWRSPGFDVVLLARRNEEEELSVVSGEPPERHRTSLESSVSRTLSLQINRDSRPVQCLGQVEIGAVMDAAGNTNTHTTECHVGIMYDFDSTPTAWGIAGLSMAIASILLIICFVGYRSHPLLWHTLPGLLAQLVASAAGGLHVFAQALSRTELDDDIHELACQSAALLAWLSIAFITLGVACHAQRLHRLRPLLRSMRTPTATHGLHHQPEGAQTNYSRVFITFSIVLLVMAVFAGWWWSRSASVNRTWYAARQTCTIDLTSTPATSLVACTSFLTAIATLAVGHVSVIVAGLMPTRKRLRRSETHGGESIEGIEFARFNLVQLQGGFALSAYRPGFCLQLQEVTVSFRTGIVILITNAALVIVIVIVGGGRNQPDASTSSAHNDALRNVLFAQAMTVLLVAFFRAVLCLSASTRIGLSFGVDDFSSSQMRDAKSVAIMRAIDGRSSHGKASHNAGNKSDPHESTSRSSGSHHRVLSWFLWASSIIRTHSSVVAPSRLWTASSTLPTSSPTHRRRLSQDTSVTQSNGGSNKPISHLKATSIKIEASDHGGGLAKGTKVDGSWG